MLTSIISYLRYFTHPKSKEEKLYQLFLNYPRFDVSYDIQFLSFMSKQQLEDYIQKAINSSYSGNQDLYLGKHPHANTVTQSIRFYQLRDAATWAINEK